MPGMGGRTGLPRWTTRAICLHTKGLGAGTAGGESSHEEHPGGSIPQGLLCNNLSCRKFRTLAVSPANLEDEVQAEECSNSMTRAAGKTREGLSALKMVECLMWKLYLLPGPWLGVAPISEKVSVCKTPSCC